MGLFPWRHYSHQSSRRRRRRRRRIVSESAFVVRRPVCKPPPATPQSLPYRTTRRRSSRTRHTASWFTTVLELPTPLTPCAYGTQTSTAFRPPNFPVTGPLLDAINLPTRCCDVRESRGQDAWLSIG